MAHAGTIDLGKQGMAKAAPGGGRLLAAGLIVVIAVATIAAVWFAIGSGLKSGTTTAQPAGTSGSQSGIYDSNLGVWMEQPAGHGPR